MANDWSNQYLTVIILQPSAGAQPAILMYSGTPAAGNLIGSWAAGNGTDAFGNTYQAGLTIGAASTGSIRLDTLGDLLSAGADGNAVIRINPTQQRIVTYADPPGLGALMWAAGIAKSTDSYGNNIWPGTQVGVSDVTYLPVGGGADDGSNISGIAATMTSGGTIRLAAGGVYVFNNPHTISNPSVRIVGAGEMQTSSTSGSVIKASASWSSANPVLTLAGEACQLANVQVSCNNLAPTAIAVSGGNCQLWNAGTRDVPAAGVCLDIQNNGVSCWVVGGRYNGKAGTLTTGSTGIRVNDTDAIIIGTKPTNQAIGVRLLSSSHGTILIGNHFTCGTTGLNDLWYDGNADSILVQGNRFDNCGAAPVQLTPSAFSHNISISDNIFMVAGSGAFPLIGLDTTAGGIRGLKIVGNNAYTDGVNIPAWFLSAITQAGAAATNTGRVGTAGTQVSTNNAWLGNAGFYAQAPTQARGNMVTLDGAAWASVADI